MASTHARYCDSPATLGCNRTDHPIAAILSFISAKKSFGHLDDHSLYFLYLSSNAAYVGIQVISANCAGVVPCFTFPHTKLSIVSSSVLSACTPSGYTIGQTFTASASLNLSNPGMFMPILLNSSPAWPNIPLKKLPICFIVSLELAANPVANHAIPPKIPANAGVIAFIAPSRSPFVIDVHARLMRCPKSIASVAHGAAASFN